MSSVVNSSGAKAAQARENDQGARVEPKKVSMANVGIEPKTFALLVRRSNQLS